MTAFAEQLLAKAGGKSAVAAAAVPTAAPAPPPAPVLVEPVQGDKPVARLSISHAAKQTGTSRDTIYRLYKAGFVKGWMPGPKKVLIDVADLHEFLAVSANPTFWTPERRARYNGKVEA